MHYKGSKVWELTGIQDKYGYGDSRIQGSFHNRNGPNVVILLYRWIINDRLQEEEHQSSAAHTLTSLQQIRGRSRTPWQIPQVRSSSTCNKWGCVVLRVTHQRMILCQIYLLHLFRIWSMMPWSHKSVLHIYLRQSQGK